METYRLPDSPSKQALIKFLKKKIEKCNEESYKAMRYEDEEIWRELERAYEEILCMIR